MIRVKYERYYNDFTREIKEKTFVGLSALADWLFDMKQGSYDRGMCFIDPDSSIPYHNGKLYLDGSCISSSDGSWRIWVHMIQNKDGIIYSDGKFTRDQCHWNEEVKQWLRDCRERQKAPKFNFV